MKRALLLALLVACRPTNQALLDKNKASIDDMRARMSTLAAAIDKDEAIDECIPAKYPLVLSGDRPNVDFVMRADLDGGGKSEPDFYFGGPIPMFLVWSDPKGEYGINRKGEERATPLLVETFEKAPKIEYLLVFAPNKKTKDMVITLADTLHAKRLCRIAIEHEIGQTIEKSDAEKALVAHLGLRFPK
jgi:hypothetical protein